jgi:transcriptional regulator with XRE-family HTH domain
VNLLNFEYFHSLYCSSNLRFYNRWEKGGNVPHFDTIVKIADILQIALDELAGRQEPSQDLKIRNHELRQLCQQCGALPDGDQQALIVMMDSLVKKSDMTKVIAKVAHG